MIALTCRLIVWLINKLQSKIYLYFLVYFVVKVCVGVFCLVNFVLKLVSVIQI